MANGREPGDAEVLRAWNAAVAPDEVRGLLHLRAVRFLEITLAPCPSDAAAAVLPEIGLAHSVLFGALRPVIDGGELVGLLADRLGMRREPADLVRGLDQAVRDLRRWLLRSLPQSATALRYGYLEAPDVLGALRGVVVIDDDGRIDLVHLSTADLRGHRSWLRAELADIRARGLVQPANAITVGAESIGPYVETWPTIRCVSDRARRD